MSNYHIDGEIGEIKFAAKSVSFTLIPSESFKHKEDEKEYAIVVQDDDKPSSDPHLVTSTLVPIKELKSAHFSLTNSCFNAQVSQLKVNRCTIRVHFDAKALDAVMGEKSAEVKVAAVDYK